MTIRPFGGGRTDRRDKLTFRFSAMIYRIAQKNQYTPIARSFIRFPPAYQRGKLFEKKKEFTQLC